MNLYLIEGSQGRTRRNYDFYDAMVIRAKSPAAARNIAAAKAPDDGFVSAVSTLLATNVKGYAGIVLESFNAG